ncbi:marvel domain-containing protein [Lineolata rhizophorae]|uniref:Marvel domain-containing protein n=1 Tax=Lineolata rhizophorae TaxID=578093 RepID=A0A6A6P4C0_9PEZI|nr:marvel domain-containing protein [Lineolata rhizophorae]
MVSRVIVLAIRGWEFLWTLLIMALIGNMIATSFAGDPSIINYDMFVSVFSMLSLFWLILVGWKTDMDVPIITLTLDTLNTIFFLCGGIATAAYLGVHSCSNDNYTLHNSITNGSVDRETRCREAQASTAFLWFGFAAYAASLVISFLGSRGSVNMRGGSRPAMSQV